MTYGVFFLNTSRLNEVTIPPEQVILDTVRQLSPEEAARFYNLSYVNLPDHLSPDVHAERLPLAIFETNSVAAGTNVGLFPIMARLNHGCSHAFNVVYSWRDREGVLVVHALKDIKEGEVRVDTNSSKHCPQLFYGPHRKYSRRIRTRKSRGASVGKSSEMVCIYQYLCVFFHAGRT